MRWWLLASLAFRLPPLPFLFALCLRLLRSEFVIECVLLSLLLLGGGTFRCVASAGHRVGEGDCSWGCLAEPVCRE